MGLLSSAWKSIKGGFKKIGKTVKKGFKKFGKFMGKFGILGQLAMSFILPGIGGMFVKGLGSMLGVGSNITSLSTLAGNLAGSTSTIAKVAGHALEYGRIAVNAATAPFKTVTSLVTNFGKGAINGITSRIPGMGNVFEGPVNWDGFTKDFGKIGEGLKTTQFNAVKANKISMDKLIAEGVDIGKGSYATEKGIYDTQKSGEQLISKEVAKGFEGQTYTDEADIPYMDRIQEYEGTRRDGSDIYSEGTYKLSDQADITPKASTAPKVKEPWTLDNMTEKTQKFGASLLGNVGESVTGAPVRAVTSMADQAFKNVVGLGPEPYSEPTDSGFNVRETGGIRSWTSQYQIDINSRQLQEQQDSIMNFMPQDMISSFNNLGYRDSNSIYDTFLRQASSFSRA